MFNEIKRFKRSLSHAKDGLIYALKQEKNFRIELFFAIFVVFFMIFFGVKNWEAVILIIMILGVLIAELANTVLERIVDILKPRIHPYARLIKDLMAAIVLMVATVSIIIGVIIFYPYIQIYISK